MYVCVCNAVRERDIHVAIAAGCRNVRDLRMHLGVAADCGRCAACARAVLDNALGAASSINQPADACCVAA